MLQHLLISIRLHDGRYHGMNEWRPSPARAFQALVAGPPSSRLTSAEKEALHWLEALPPPIVGTPLMIAGQRISTFVPDNDIDAVAGHTDRVAEIRSAKIIQPQLFDCDVPFLFAWTTTYEGDVGSEGDEHARRICELATSLYQFGRGVDMGWARGEILDVNELEARFSSYHGRLARPARGVGTRSLRCPTAGSFASLEARHSAQQRRFTLDVGGGKQLFAQPPKPHFADVAYDTAPARKLFELKDESAGSPFKPWPFRRVVELVTLLRDGAVERLSNARPKRSDEIRRSLIGRQADGSDAGPTNTRVKILALPSIGHEYADHGIRRVLIEVPSDCPLRADDVYWAFSGLPVSDSETGEVFSVLTPAIDETMLAHYGIGSSDHEGARIWRTVTPAALPERASRRRIEPTRRHEESKGGTERITEDARAAHEVREALRHVDLTTRVESIRVQREPFEAKGDRVEAFAKGTRFAKERLWHVELAFVAPIPGPIVVGDGRFLGLGILQPIRKSEGIHALQIRGQRDEPFRGEQAKAICLGLRRATMARVQRVLGPRQALPTFFSGHGVGGTPSRDHRHLAFALDPSSARLLIVAPHVLGRRRPFNEEKAHLAILERALRDFTDLRVGAHGRFQLESTTVQSNDPLTAPSTTWKTATPYWVTRHTRRVAAEEALLVDVLAECNRVGLPRPRVTVDNIRGGNARHHLVADVRLTFETAIVGPLLIGKTLHLGGGLFVSE